MIRIAQYRGKSFISRLIRVQTRSVYSHSAVILQDNTVIAACPKGGVSHVESLSTNHSPGTQVDLFRIECFPAEADIFEKYLLSQVGKGYDFKSVFRFLSKVPARLNDKWFCSELVVDALNHVNIYPLMRICPAEVSPQLLSISPLMLPMSKMITGKVYDSKFLCHQS